MSGGCLRGPIASCEGSRLHHVVTDALRGACFMK